MRYRFITLMWPFQVCNFSFLFFRMIRFPLLKNFASSGLITTPSAAFDPVCNGGSPSSAGSEESNPRVRSLTSRKLPRATALAAKKPAAVRSSTALSKCRNLLLPVLLLILRHTHIITRRLSLLLVLSPPGFGPVVGLPCTPTRTLLPNAHCPPHGDLSLLTFPLVNQPSSTDKRTKTFWKRLGWFC